MVGDCRTVLSFLVAPLLLALTATSTAALIERDLVAPGDGLVTYDTASGLEWLDTSVLAYADKYDIYWGWLEGRTNRVDPIYDDVIGGWSAASFAQVVDLFGRYSGVYPDDLGPTPLGQLYLARLLDEPDQSGMSEIGSLIFGQSRPLIAAQVYFGSNFISSTIDGDVANSLGYLNIWPGPGHRPDRYAGYELFHSATTRPGPVLNEFGALIVRQGAALPVPAPPTIWLLLVALLPLSVLQRRRSVDVYPMPRASR